jgi:hypothetical protein
MRRWSAGAILFVAMLGLGLALRQTLRLRAALSPPELRTESLPLDGVASIWIFVRAGCAHCEAHLASLCRGLELLPPARRDRARARLRVVGRVHLPFSDVRVFPDSLRTALGVRVVPSTWCLDPDGRVHESWRGARDVTAWRRLLLDVSEPEARR